MRLTDETRRYVIANYVEPARRRGERTIQVRVGNVLKELGWNNRTPSVFSTLISEDFQKQAGLKLEEKFGGPESGGPSTTWNLVYRILEEPNAEAGSANRPGGLLSLYGICAEMYREVGGAEAFIRSQREDFGSIAPSSEKSDRGDVQGKIA
jgi:hypothetical protein